MAAANWFRYTFLAHLARPKGNRQLYRTVKRHAVSRIVEIGMSNLERAESLIQVAQRFAGDKKVWYTGIDMFDARPTGRDAAGAEGNLPQTSRDRRECAVGSWRSADVAGLCGKCASKHGFDRDRRGSERERFARGLVLCPADAARELDHLERASRGGRPAFIQQHHAYANRRMGDPRCHTAGGVKPSLRGPYSARNSQTKFGK